MARLPKGRRSLGEEVFNILRLSILRGDLAPGKRLIEEKIALQHGASRTPVREAFHKLEREGLVERRDKGGFVVAQASPGDVDEIMDLRAVLEGHAAARAARRTTPELVGRLRDKLALYEAAMKGPDPARLIEANTVFHDLLYEASGSQRLRRTIGDLREHFYRLRRSILGLEGMAQQSYQDHEAIIEAIARGDAAEAERLVREHIERARLALRRELEAGRLKL